MRTSATAFPIPARCPASQRKNHRLLLLWRRQCSGDFRGALLRRLECQPSSLSEAKKLHGVALVNGLLRRGSRGAAAVMQSRLAGAYAALGGAREAQLVFPAKSATSAAWNSVLRRAVEARRFPAAMAIFRSMLAVGPPPDGYTYPLLLKACADSSALERGREIYRSIARPNVFAQCAAVDMFAKCGSLEEARRVFEEMPQRDLVSWTAMICGAMQNGSWSEALILFKRMRSEGLGFDSVTLATVAPACGRVAAPLLGMALHGGAVAGGVAGDLCVRNSLIDMYCKCGLTRLAEAVFSAMELRDSISWSSLITGYSQNHRYSESSRLFAAMIAARARPSSVTLAGVLPAFSGLKLLQHGKEIHGYAVRNLFHLDSFVASAMIDLYSQCGALAKAELVFAGGRGQDLAVWNSMISGYAMTGEPSLAFEALRGLLHAGLRPTSVTVVAVLPLCGRWTMLDRGRELHGYAIRSGLLSATTVSNSLIDMYCKCGLLIEGEKLFQRAPRRDAVTFNTMIAALGMHGHGRRAVACFAAMGEEKIEPDKVTFVALLSACSHAGLVDEGLAVFRSMVEDRGIRPEMEHYSCMVDLHGRSGRLEEAWDFIRRMPVEPEVDVLGSLLGACRVHRRDDLAELVGGWIMEKKETVDPGYHLLLANTYAWSGRWREAARVRRMARERGLRKRVPGSSWIQAAGAAHRFSASEGPHPLTEEVDVALRSLLCQMKDHGYSPDVGCLLLPEVAEQEDADESPD